MPSHVFFSYAQGDRDAPALVAMIERCGHAVWWDRKGLRQGVQIDRTIADAIRAASKLVLAASPAYFASDYCLDEYTYALDQARIGTVPILLEELAHDRLPIRVHRQMLSGRPLRQIEPGAWQGEVARSLLAGGLKVDETLLPAGEDAPDPQGSFVHPPYEQLERASDGQVQAWLARCQRALSLNARSGWHAINLALLLVHLGQAENAGSHARAALAALPAEGEVHYLAALVAVARGPLAAAPRERVQAIEALLDASVRLGYASGLPHLLMAALVQEHFVRHGIATASLAPSRLVAKAVELGLEKGETRRAVAVLARSAPGFSRLFLQR